MGTVDVACLRASSTGPPGDNQVQGQADQFGGHGSVAFGPAVGAAGFSREMLAIDVPKLAHAAQQRCGAGGPGLRSEYGVGRAQTEVANPVDPPRRLPQRHQR